MSSSSGLIYLLQGDNQLVEMAEQRYDSEDLLQDLLASHPNLLAGEQINTAVPRRWLLISRELALPSDEGGAGRWSVDHLFLDQDAIPTVVEVKRSSDSRIRREVVGQMLDYAANAVVYWPVEAIRAEFEANCATRGCDAEQELRVLLDGGAEPEQFWQQVKTNLQAGKIRLVFVADEIPVELRRVVEFLREQMDPAEVLAVEIKQYVGQGLKALVPRVVSQTAQLKFGSATKRQRWDAPSFFQALSTRQGTGDADVAKKILDWADTRKLSLWWGYGKQEGHVAIGLNYQGAEYWPLAVLTSGRVEVRFGDLLAQPPFEDESKSLELRERLNRLPDIAISSTKTTKLPKLRLSTLRNGARLQAFLDTGDWIVQTIRGT
ncbi:MAG: hypothetical protein M3Q65_06910 [Chloroflexota bacterium]|nr:hypothetical protein [Chloroflexota bacterium]